MKIRLLIIIVFLGAILGGIIGSITGIILYPQISPTLNLHDGVYEMRFGNGLTHKFIIYNDRLHLAVPLPVTTDSSTIDIIKTKKKSKK